MVENPTSLVFSECPVCGSELTMSDIYKYCKLGIDMATNHYSFTRAFWEIRDTHIINLPLVRINYFELNQHIINTKNLIYPNSYNDLQILTITSKLDWSTLETFEKKFSIKEITKIIKKYIRLSIIF